MLKRLPLGILTALLISCGGNKEDIKGSSIEPLSDSNKLKLQALGAKKVADLSPQEQQTVADIMYDTVSKIKVSKMMKQMCHIAGVMVAHMPNAPKCEEVQSKCRDNIPANIDDEFSKEFKANESTIKSQLKTFLSDKNDQLAAQDLISMLDVLNDILSQVEKIDCDSSQAHIKKVSEDLNKKYGGEEQYKKYEQNGQKMMEAVGIKLD